MPSKKKLAPPTSVKENNDSWGLFIDTEEQSESVATETTPDGSNNSSVSKNDNRSTRPEYSTPPFPKYPKTISQSKAYPGEIKKWMNTINKNTREQNMKESKESSSSSLKSLASGSRGYTSYR